MGTDKDPMADQEYIRHLEQQNALLEEINTRQHLNDEDEMDAAIVSWLLYPFILVGVGLWHVAEWGVDKLRDKYKKTR